MSNPFLNFTIQSIILLFVVFGIHITILHLLGYPLFNDRIIGSYIANVLLIIAEFGILYKIKKKHQNQLTYRHILGSGSKFAVFLIFFHPFYKLDGDISRFEFAAFFIPYATGLIFETISLGKWLNYTD
jgi:Ca2+/Na+ antiporter